MWLDKEGAYTAFADELAGRAEAGQFSVPVRRLRGSYLELMLGLEDLEDGVGMTPLIVHVPGHTEESIAETPLFELYRAGRRYRRALPTLIREAALGRATPEAIEALVAGEGLTVERADVWLAAREAEARHGDEPDLGTLGPEALFDALMPAGTLASQIDQPAVAAAVRRRAGVLLGVDEPWYARDGVDAPERPSPRRSWRRASRPGSPSGRCASSWSTICGASPSTSGWRRSGRCRGRRCSRARSSRAICAGATPRRTRGSTYGPARLPVRVERAALDGRGR